MLLRFAGLATLLVGIGALAFVAWGIAEAPAFSRNLAALARMQGTALDPADWLFHWRLSLMAIGVAAAALTSAGVAMLRARWWGLLIVSAVALAIAAFPWLLAGIGGGRYAFESPNVLETVLLVAVSVATAAIYFARGRRVALSITHIFSGGGVFYRSRIDRLFQPSSMKRWSSLQVESKERCSDSVTGG